MNVELGSSTLKGQLTSSKVLLVISGLTTSTIGFPIRLKAIGKLRGQLEVIITYFLKGF